MRNITMAYSLCTIVLLGGSAWGAPRRTPQRSRAKPPTANIAAPATEIAVTEQSGTDVRGFGVATTWRLRSNGTVVREGNLPGENMGDPGENFREHGTFDKADFQPLAAFLEWSKLLDQKVRPSQEMEGYTSFSLVRGGKRREVVIPDSAPPTSASWAAMRLLRAITSRVD